MTHARFGLTTSILIVTIALPIALTSAATAAGQTPPASLEGTSWRAIELAGMQVPSSPGAREAYLDFGAAGRLSGSDGCNRLTGPYTAKGESITFGAIVSTRMACPGAEEISRRFNGALKGTGHWRITAGRLEFYGATGKPLAVFERRTPEAPSAPSLEGTSWQLVKFQGGDDRTLTPDDRRKYTIEFAPKGQLIARVDCNRGRGTWKATSSGQLELGPLALTRAKCPDGSLHDQIVKQWSAIRSFVIKDGHLFLSLMADGGIYELEPAVVKKQP